MKVHIIGYSGSGKSFVAEEISKKYKINHYDLDNLFWDNNSDKYGVPMKCEKRNEILKTIVNEENWVIEGVYYKWLKESFEKADYIFLLEKNIYVCYIRIIKRFIKRKLKIEKGKKENIQSLIGLLKWTRHYKKKEIKNIIKFLEDYKKKVIVVRDSYEIIKCL